MTDKLIYKKWFGWGLINLAIVALYGSLMRYKIAFNFPYLEQKSLLHAHSHFAFNGWISHILYSILAYLMISNVGTHLLKKYRYLIIANLLSAFGMLAAFTIQGYKIPSISFAALSIVIAIIFCYHYIKDSRSLPVETFFKPWAIVALILNIISAIGVLYLAYILITRTAKPDSYLASLYYYLHFQYNGWFFFGAMAIVTSMLPISFKPVLKKHFILFTVTVIPTFFLSTLWAKLPMWLYIITVIATLIQFYAWFSLLSKCLPALKFQKNKETAQWVNIFLYGAVFAMTIKFTLQTISIIPSLSHLVFGIRSIVIAYLHLILLGVYSLFIIGYLFLKGWIKVTPTTKIISLSFLAGVVLNEAFLGIQGVAAFAYISIPYINETLFGVALLLFLSSLSMAIVYQFDKE